MIAPKTIYYNDDDEFGVRTELTEDCEGFVFAEYEFKRYVRVKVKRQVMTVSVEECTMPTLAKPIEESDCPF